MKWSCAALLMAGTAFAQSQPNSALEDRLLAVGLDVDVPQASSSAAPKGATADDELAEVQILGQKPRSRRAIAAWLRLLPGSYRNEGTLTYSDEVSGTLEFNGGRKVPVSGMTECTVIGKGPGVQCLITLTVPAEDTHLNPGMMLFGLDIERPLIRYMTVDDTGIAAGDSGDLRGDTVKFRTPCISAESRECFSRTWISAEAGSNKLIYRLEIEVDGKAKARFDVTLSRVKQDP